MLILNKINSFFTDSEKRVSFLASKGFYNYMSDMKYLSIKYKSVFGREINWDNPQSFNEKLQWLKVFDHNEKYIIMVDKHLAKSYVADIIGQEYIIPTIGVWDNVEDIDFASLPDRFVLKCNHNSGLGMCICKDKSKLDVLETKKQLKKGLKQDYYLTNREWPYKNVDRKIIAEEYMEDSNQPDLIDYKFMCFNGVVKCSFVCDDRFSKDGLKVTFYDRNWNIMPFERHYPRRIDPINRPKNYEQMIVFAEKLSKSIPFLRVDFYEINGKTYFGELTFFPGAGFEEFTPEEWDYKLGEWIKIP